MIDLHAAGSPNVFKILIALEEMGLTYDLHLVDLMEGANYTREFLALSPTAKVPVIVDHDAVGGSPHSVFESGAILIYLAERTGRFLPTEPAARSEAVQWLMMQMANVGPYFGQFVHFSRYAPDVPYAHARYKTIVRNMLDVVESRLGQSPFIGGENYTIADMAFLPWFSPIDLLLGEGTREKYPSIRNWLDTLNARPAVVKAFELAADIRKRLPAPSPSAPVEHLDRLLGRGAYSRI